MERDANKRKASQELLSETSDPKYRRTQPPHTITSRRASTLRSTITEKIVSLWKEGSGLTSVATQEGKDIVSMQELEVKYMQIEKINQSMQKKLSVSEENVAELNILLKKEATEKQNLLTKISTTGELLTNISEHINCVTENLDRFQTQINNLSDKYEHVILKLRSENVAVKAESDQVASMRQAAVQEIQERLEEKQLQFNELRVKCEVLENEALQEKERTCMIVNELENNRRKILEMQKVEEQLKFSITKLKNAVTIEREKLKEINNSEEEKIEEMRNNYELKISELRKKFEESETHLLQVEENRIEMLKLLEEKNSLIESQTADVDLYQKQSRDLMCQLTDTELNYQRVKDEKADLEKQLQLKSIDLSRCQQELEAVSQEKRTLTNEKNELNKSLNREVKERMVLSADLTRSKIQLQETNNHNDVMNKHLNQYKEDKENEMKTLKTQIANLNQKLEQVLIEKNTEMEIRSELEEKYENEMKIHRDKYEKCLADLEKLSKSMEKVTKKDLSTKSALSTMKAEKEKLQKQFASKKKIIEGQLQETKELLAKKSSVEQELKEQISKLEIDLMNAEKKYTDLESAKDTKIMILEKKLSNLEVSTTAQSTSPIQTRKKSTNTVKNIRVTTNEVLNAGNIKSILKPLGKAHSPKVSPKTSPKKISFNFGSDSSDDPLSEKNSELSCFNKFNELISAGSHKFKTQLSNSQLSIPENEVTPKSNKFFKSRGSS